MMEYKREPLLPRLDENARILTAARPYELLHRENKAMK